MSDDYAYPSKRKSKNDKKAKGRFNRYKKGGQFRSANVSMNENRDERN